MFYPDYPDVEIPKCLEAWNHDGLYHHQFNPCSYLTLKGGYTLIVFVGNEDMDRNVCEVTIEKGGDTGATFDCPLTDLEVCIERIKAYPYKNEINTWNIVLIAYGRR